MSVRILIGDVRDRLRDLPDESVHCVVTSPPYWGLRDYGVPGQLGLEPTPEEHVETMTGIFREVRRVLRKDGTAWVNYGDCYANAVQAGDKVFGNPEFNKNRPSRAATKTAVRSVPCGLKPKDLVGMPWRIAFALQADGWYLRSDIIWHKPNPMPESVTDRPTKSHEYVFLLSKALRYYYDAEAVREPHAEPERGHGETEKNNWSVDGNRGSHDTIRQYNPLGRNLRTVWTIPTHAYKGAHFATFPPKLAETCIKAGCPKDGTVLDPFGGAGTTGLVADRLGRHAILIELNETYAKMARQRIYSDAPLLVDVEVD